MTHISLLDGRAALVPVVANAGERGILTAIELAGLDFATARVFTVSAPDGAVRGGHAHREGRQLLMRVSGTIEVDLRTRDSAERVIMEEGSPALLLGRGVWSSQTYRGTGATLLVLCDTPYDPTDYFDHAS